MDETQKTNDQSTSIIPLNASKLYLGEGQETVSLDVSIVNGIKVSFMARQGKGDSFKYQSATLYLIDVIDLLEGLLRDIETKVSFQVSNTTSYGGARKESTLNISKNDTGTWTLRINGGNGTSAAFTFTGIRRSTLQVDRVEISGEARSRRHLETWIKVFLAQATTVMSILAIDNKRILPPRGDGPVIS